MLDRLLSVLKARFGSAPALMAAPQGVGVLADMANRRVMRRYLDKPVDPVLLAWISQRWTDVDGGGPSGGAGVRGREAEIDLGVIASERQLAAIS